MNNLILKTKLFGHMYEFKSLREVMAKANEEKSGDKLAGIAATVAVHLWRGNRFLRLFVGTGVCVVLANGWLAHFL